jgi:PKD repeat protein
VTDGGVLEGIGEEIVNGDPAQPIDILALEETTSNATTVQPIVDGLNAFYSVRGPVAGYAMSPYQATESGGSPIDGNGPNALVYNTNTVQLLASVPVDPPGGISQLGSLSGEYREVMRYEFAPAGVTPTSTNEFYIYVSHYKASTGSVNAALRLGEAQIIRNDEASNLPATARVIYLGDYNPDDNSSEPAYQTILSNSAPSGVMQGQGVDPLNTSGATNIDWSDTTTDTNILFMLSEESYELRYRDDLQVMTSNVYYDVAGGLQYVPGTYHSFGNNATIPWGSSVTNASNTALSGIPSSALISAAQCYTNLTAATDHLPVVADYTIPIPLTAPVASFTASPTNGFAPLAVTFMDTSSGTITNRFWDFGDATTTNTVATTIGHTYNTNGSFTVQLIVSGPGGVSSNTQTGCIIVAAPCTFPLSATNASFGDFGGNGTVTVTPYTNVCAWTATSNDSWIQIAGGSVSATGSLVIAYTVLSNTTTTNSRTGTMTIAGQTFTVTQLGDTTPPTVTLTTSASGIVSNVITLSATATDDVAVVKVEFYRESSVLLGTVTAPPYSLNFDTTSVGDGPHCFTAKAYDPAGNVGSSAAACVSVDNNPPTTPTGLTAQGVSTTAISLSWTASTDAGSGVAFYTVYRDGTQIATTTGATYTDTDLTLETEHCYTVTATDNAERTSPSSAQACGQTFTTVAALAGTYNGLLISTNAPSFASSGPFTLVLDSTGTFTASMKLGPVPISFKGQLDASGNTEGAVLGGTLGTLQVALHLDLAGTDQITGTVLAGAFTSQLLAGRAAFGRANPCPLAGAYTAVLQSPTNSAANVPQGFGYGTLTVTPKGNGLMTGFLGDGTRLTVSAPLSKQGTWPLYETLYGGQGAALGWVTIGTNGLVDATVDWFRPASPASSFYPAGFSTVVTLDGDKYVRPVNSGPSFSGNGQLTLGDGNLGADIVYDLYIDAKGNVSFTFENHENVQMNLNPATGQFSGSFTHSTLNRTVTFRGLVLQPDKTGAGYFMGTGETGFAVIELLP